MSRYNQFLDNAVKNAIASVQRQQAPQNPASSITNAAQIAASRVPTPMPVSTPSPLSMMGMANTSARPALPDPAELGRQAAQMIQRNTAQTTMSALQERLSQPTPARPLNAGVFGQPPTDLARYNPSSSFGADMRSDLAGALASSPIMGVQKAAQFAAGEGAENRPGSSTSASTGQRLSLFNPSGPNAPAVIPMDTRPSSSTSAATGQRLSVVPGSPLVVVYGPDGKTVIMPQSQAASLPSGWQTGSTITDPQAVERAKQSPQYIGNQDEQTKTALTPVVTPAAPASGTVRPIPIGNGPQAPKAGPSGAVEPDRRGLGTDVYVPGTPVSAKPSKNEVVIVTNTKDPNAAPVAMSETDYWQFYANDPDYRPVTDSGTGVPGGVRQVTEEDVAAQQQKQIAPSADKGDPNATPDIGDYALRGAGAAAGGVGTVLDRSVGSAYRALPDWIKSPVGAVGNVAGKVGSAILETGLGALDEGRAGWASSAGDAVYKDVLVGGKKESSDPAVAWVDTWTFATTGHTYSEYIYENQATAKQVYENGYDSNGDGVVDYTGGRALWEWYVSSLPTWQRAPLDVFSDPLTYAAGVGAAGDVVSKSGKAIRLAEGATKTEKAAGGVAEIIGGAMKIPTSIADKPVDAAVDKVFEVGGKIPLFRQSAASAAEEAKGQATGTFGQVLAREDRRVPGGEGGSAVTGSPPEPPKKAPVSTAPEDPRTSSVVPDTAKPTVPEAPVVDETGNRPPSSAAAPTETTPASVVPTEKPPVSKAPESWGVPEVSTVDNTTIEAFPSGHERYTDNTTGEVETYYPDGAKVTEAPTGEQTVEYRQPDGSYVDTPPASTVDPLPTSNEVVADAAARNASTDPLGREVAVAAQDRRIEILTGPNKNQVLPDQVGVLFDSSGLDSKAKQVVETVNTRAQRNAASDYKMYVGRPDTFPARQEIDIAAQIANEADIIEAAAGTRVTPNVPPAVGKRTAQGDDVRKVLFQNWDNTTAERYRLYQTGAVSHSKTGNIKAKRAYVDMVDTHARFVPSDVANSQAFRDDMLDADALRYEVRSGGERPRVKERYQDRRATRGKKNLGITVDPRADAGRLAERTEGRINAYADSARRNAQAKRGGTWTDDVSEDTLRGRALARSESIALNDPRLTMPVDVSGVDRTKRDWQRVWENGDSTKPVPAETPRQRFERKADEYESKGVTPQDAEILAAQETIRDMEEWQRVKYGRQKGKADGAFGQAISNSIDVYRTMQKMQREAMLTSVFSGARYATNQVVGNALTSFITGHGITINLAEQSREFRGARMARRTAERDAAEVKKASLAVDSAKKAESEAKTPAAKATAKTNTERAQSALDAAKAEQGANVVLRDGVTVGEASQVMTKADEFANKVGYRVRDNVETSTLNMVDGTPHRTAWAQMLGAGTADGTTGRWVADKAASVMSSEIVRDAATSSDIYVRKAIQKKVVDQNWAGLLDDITEDVVKKTGGRVGKNDMLDFIDRQGGAFGQDDLYKFITGEGIDSGTATRIGRDWQAGVNRAYEEGAKEVKRVMFYGKTNADEFLNNVFNFHYWLVRGSKLYAQEIFTNPALLANYIRMNKGLERMAEDGGYPSWLTGTIRLASNFFGFNIYANPMQFVQTLITARYSDFTPDDQAGWVSWLEKTGLMVSGPAATALGMAGYTGDRTPQDPIGLSVISGPLTEVANVVQSQTNASGGVIADPITQAMNFAASKTSGKAPGSAKVQPKTGTEQKNREINEVIIAIAEERGLISADEAERARQAEVTGQTLPDEVANAMSNPDDPLWQEAYRRVATKDAGLRVVRATPLGALYPSVRTSERDRREAVNDRGTAEKTGVEGVLDDVFSIARTGVPDNGRDPNPKSQVPLDQQVGPSAQPESMSPREKALRNYYGGSYQAAMGSTATQNQANDEGRLTNAATPESVRLYNEVEQGRKLDEKYYREKQIQDRAQAIQDGDNGTFESVIVNGQYYSGEQIAAMSSGQRENLSKAWLADQGMTGEVNAYLNEKTALRAGQNPVTQNYYEWRNTTYKTGDQVGYAKRLAEVNPSYGAYYNSLDEQQKQNPGSLFSAEAYIAFTGGQADYNSPTGLKTTDTGAIIADPASPNGTYSPYVVESKSSGGSSSSSSGSSTPPKTHAQSVRDDQAKYERETAAWEWQTTQVLGYVPGPTPTKNEKAVLKEAGLDQSPPSKSDYLQDYDFWVTQQPAGSDTTPEAYEAWRLDKGYQEKPVDKDAPPPGVPIGGSSRKSPTRQSFGDRATTINAMPSEQRNAMIFSKDGSLSTFGVLLSAEAKRNGYKITADGTLVKSVG